MTIGTAKKYIIWIKFRQFNEERLTPDDMINYMEAQSTLDAYRKHLSETPAHRARSNAIKRWEGRERYRKLV